MSAKSPHGTAAFILLLTSVGQGVGYVTGKASLLEQAPLVAGESSWFVAAQNLVPRFLFGVLLLLVIHGPRVLQLTRTEWMQAGLMALCSFCGCMLQLDGQQFTSASSSAFITQFYVVLLPVWSAIAARRWPGLAVWIAGLLVLAGTAVLAQIDWRHFSLGRGEAETLLASLFFSVMFFAINRPGFAGTRPERTAAGMFAIETVLFAFVCWLTVRESASLIAPLASMPWNMLIVFSTLIATVGPFILINRWQRFLSETEAGLIYSLVPLFAAISGLFLPALVARLTGLTYANESLTHSLVIGGALILAANAVLQLSRRAHSRRTVSPRLTD